MHIDPDSGAPLLDTPSGRVSGSWHRRPGCTDVAVFRAVPVAAEHTGDALFAPPEAAPAWSGTMECPDTPERRALLATHTVTVFCLSGGRDSAESRPVLAWVHGGRFETGHGDEHRFDGTDLARQGCVVVALNYRKRFEGFLPLDPGTDGRDGTTGRFRGVEDLLTSLTWIRDCIGGIGGDHRQVTLTGQSAGGALVAWLMTDPRAADLFSRAVMLSPGAPRRGWTSRRLTTRLALGVRRRPVSAEGLCALTAAELTAAYTRFARMHATDCAVGVYPLDVYAMRPLPVLIGTMHDEFIRFPGVAGVDAALRRTLGRLGIPPVVDAWLVSPAMLALGVPLRSLARWCRVVSRVEPVHPLGRTVGDRTIRRWASAVADALDARGAPVWAYEFSGGGAGPQSAAMHCGELPLLFNTLQVGPAEVEKDCGPGAQHRLGGPGGTGEQFRRTVVDFVHGREPDWPRYTAHNRVTRTFDTSGTGRLPRLVRDPWKSVRRLLGRLY